MSDFTIIVEAPPTITCVAETVTLVEAVPIGAPGPAGTAGAHTHPQSDVTGLVADLAAKADAAAMTTALAGKAASSHTHPQSDVTGLVADLAAKADAAAMTTALAGKAASSHTHAQSDVTGLVADLAAKMDTPTLALCGSDFAWSTSLIDQPWSGLTIPSTGIWQIDLVLLTSTTVSQTLTPRVVMGTAVISGVTGDVVGSGGVAVTGATITTGSPTVIGIVGGAGTSVGRVFSLVVSVVTAGTIKLQIAHNNGAGGLKTCKGSFLKLTKIG